MTDDTTPPQIDWLERWDTISREPAVRRAYVADELERLHAAGQPALYAAVTAPFADQVDYALAHLVTIQPMTTLALRAGAVPPPRDPEGHPLPPEQQGKVLVAYLGDNGAPAGATGGVSEAWTGLARVARHQHRKSNFRTVRLEPGRPVSLPTVDAAEVLRQWGVGVKPIRYYNRQAKPSDPEYLGQDQWLVVEVPANAPPAPVAAPPPAPAKSRAA